MEHKSLPIDETPLKDMLSKPQEHGGSNVEYGEITEASPQSFSSFELSSEYDWELTKIPQQTNTKRFNLLSTFSLAVTLMATWEALLCTMGSGLISGGPVSLIFGFLVCSFGALATAMSLSEPASMFPSAGGQYFFAGQLTSPKYRLVLSWYSGWLTLLGWLALTASAPYGAANLINGLITLNNPSYETERWKTTLLYWAIIGMAFPVNYWGTNLLPLIQTCVMVLHVVFFFAVFIAVCVIPPSRNSVSFVFESFRNSTGWENDGVAWCIGLLTSAYVLTGFDSATHISEEVMNPRKAVPRAMIGCIVANGTMAFALLVAVMFGMGDLDQALGSFTGFPIIQIFFYMTRQNMAATSALTATIIISASLATIGLIASSSRMLWDFARDEGPIFSNWLSKVDERKQIPSNAIISSSAFIVLLGILNIASTTAFTAILSLAVVALMLSYLIPVIAMLYRRLFKPQSLNYGPWHMSDPVAIIANVVSICYLLLNIVFLLLPPYQPVTAQNMNYASVLLGGVLLLTTIDFFLRAKKTYKGPKPPSRVL